MNLHGLVRKYTDEFKDVISDPELMAINRINRYLGEVNISDAFMNLIQNKKKLLLQDYEFFANIPGYIELLSVENKSIRVENLSIETVYWALNMAMAIEMRNIEVTFHNFTNNLSIIPSSNFAKEVLTKISRQHNTNQTGLTESSSIKFVDATDDLNWNSVLEMIGSNSQKSIVCVKNYNRVGIVEEPFLLTSSGLECVQSIAGWALLVPTR